MPFYFIFLLKEHFLHATESLCSSASVWRFRTCPQSHFSDDKHHWPLGKHLKSTLHLDSPVLTLSVTRTDFGSLKSKKKNCFSSFLLCLFSVCSQRFSVEILKSQPSDKTAGNINSVRFLSQLGTGFKNTLAPALKIRPNSNHATITRRKMSNNFPAHAKESTFCLTLVRPDLVFLLTDTCCTSSDFGFTHQVPKSYFYILCTVFSFNNSTTNTFYHFSSWQPLLN